MNLKKTIDVIIPCYNEIRTIEKVIFKFLLSWLDDLSYIEVQTSGTTGKPKIIRIEKRFVIASALSTGNFLKLQRRFFINR